MRNPYSGIDPLVLMTSLLMGIKDAKSRPKPPPTPEQIERWRVQDERDKWNAEVAARKAAKVKKQTSANAEE
jgi:hypothetical protein